MTGPRILVREAGPEDWPVWRDVRLRALATDPGAFGSTYEQESTFTEADWRGRLAGFAVLATVDAEPAGIGAAFADRPGWLRMVSLWTDPTVRGLGVGRLILARLVSHAQDTGRRAHLDVVAGNRAQLLYESLGFVDTGEREELRPGRGVYLVRMELAAQP